MPRMRLTTQEHRNFPQGVNVMAQIKHLDEIYDTAYDLMEKLIRHDSHVITDLEETVEEYGWVVLSRLAHEHGAIQEGKTALLEMATHIRFRQQVAILLSNGRSRDTPEAQAALDLIESQRSELNHAAVERTGRREQLSASLGRIRERLGIGTADQWAARQGDSRHAAAVKFYLRQEKTNWSQIRHEQGQRNSQQERERQKAREPILQDLAIRNLSVASAAAVSIADAPLHSRPDHEEAASLAPKTAASTTRQVAGRSM